MLPYKEAKELRAAPGQKPERNQGPESSSLLGTESCQGRDHVLRSGPFSG